MATTLAFSLYTPIRASSASGSRKPQPNRRRAAPSASPNWWSPLFGWTSYPDYYVNKPTEKKESDTTNASGDTGGPGSKFSVGCFTEEKANQLRRKMAESSSFHDLMYHSTIASRLVSDISVRSEKCLNRVMDPVPVNICGVFCFAFSLA